MLFSAELTEESAEEISELLLEMGASSVEVSDYDAGTSRETFLFREPGMVRKDWQRAAIKAILPSSRAERIAESIRSDYGVEVSLSDFEDADWLSVQEALRPPVTIGGLRIILPWHSPSSEQLPLGDLRVEGGAAFGTGEHPTTRMCAAWLQSNLPAFATVMDYGCGSGILGLVALKAGAALAVGVDVDLDAVLASRRNAVANGFDEKEAGFYFPHRWTLDADARKNDDAKTLPDSLARAKYDVVVANILLNPLLELKDNLCDFLQPNTGMLLIAGIRTDQFDTLRTAYQDRVELHILDDTDGWLLVSSKV